MFHHCTSPLNSQNIRIAKTSKTFLTPTKIKLYLFYLQIFFVVKKARSQPFPSRQGFAIVVSSTEGLADNSQTKDTHNAHVSIDMNKPMRRPWWLIQKKCGTQIIFHQRKARTFRCFFMLYRYSWNFVSRTFPSLSLASLSSVWMPTDHSLFVIGGKKGTRFITQSENLMPEPIGFPLVSPKSLEIPTVRYFYCHYLDDFIPKPMHSF